MDTSQWPHLHHKTQPLPGLTGPPIAGVRPAHCSGCRVLAARFSLPDRREGKVFMTALHAGNAVPMTDLTA